MGNFMQTKICSKCGIEKEISCFCKHKGHKHGRNSWCRECKKVADSAYYFANKEKRSKKNKCYRLKNKNKKTEYDKQYYQKNREKKIEYQHIYCKNNKEKISARVKKYQKENRESLNLYFVKRKKEDTNFKLACNLRNRLYAVLKGKTKKGSAIGDLGCTVSDLKIYLESKFYCHPTTGEMMTWENYGKLWHIDHIKPLSSFDLTNREQLLEACNYTNLQPLWAEENLKKGSKIL